MSQDKGPIGAVTIAGEIVDGKAGLGTAGAETIVRAIEKGLKKDDLKLRWWSGSTASGSAIARADPASDLAAKEKKIPVVVSMGTYAASGGYWVSTPGDFIFAEPSTVTGSIGAFGLVAELRRTLTKLGIGADGVWTTPLSGEPDLLHGLSDAADALIQAGVEYLFALPRHRRGGAAQDPGGSLTASRRAACGTAEPPASSA